MNKNSIPPTVRTDKGENFKRQIKGSPYLMEQFQLGQKMRLIRENLSLLDKEEIHRLAAEIEAKLNQEAE